MFLKFKKSGSISFLLVLCIMLSSISVFAQEESLNTLQVELSRFEKYDIKSNSTSKEKLGSNAQESEAYTYIKNGLMDLDVTMNIEAFKLSRESFGTLIKNILVDNPDIFYIRGWSYSYSSSGIVTSITPKYDYDNNTIISMRSEIDSKVDFILKSIIKDDMTDFQKELAIHDYLVLNSEYDSIKFSDGSYAKESHNIYGTLVRGVGVCESYAESFKLLLNKVGIECMVVISTPSMNHAWNIVNLDGKNYHVDVTWDDPTPDKPGITNYSYLNLTDDRIGLDHYWDATNYPTSNSEDYSYLWDMSNPIAKDNYIYYSSNQNNFEYIYKLNLDTLIKKQITSDRAPFFCIIGDWLYFSNYSRGAKIYKTNIDGSGEELFHDVASKNIYSEGNRIYFTEYDTNNKRYIEIESEVPEIINVESVTLNKDSLDLLEGDISNLVATVNPTNATNKNMIWQSSNPSVATVDNNGNIVAVTEGTAVITSKTIDGNFTANCNVTVIKDQYDGYKKWEEKLGVSSNKEWIIKFNQSILESSINNNNIYITDISGNVFDNIISTTDNKTISIKPTMNYKSGKTYYLYIENMKSQNGKELQSDVKMKFTVK